MFAAWVERAAGDGDEYMLLDRRGRDGVTGVCDPRPHARAPGRPDGGDQAGLGRVGALMQGFFDWAGGGPIEAGPCAARNIAPLRFLERCGFEHRRDASTSSTAGSTRTRV